MAVSALPNPPDREAFVDRMRAAAPLLAEHAAEAEALRRLPDATMQALADAEVQRCYVPRRYGGYEMDFEIQVDIGLELGRACAAAAWCGVFFAQHPLAIGMMPPAAQDAVWGGGPDVFIANAFFTGESRCEVVEGGFLLDGPWMISSGVDHCSWNNLNVLAPTGEGPPEHRFMLVPRDAYKIVDDWHATGLCGTGSNTIRLERVFVPAEHTLRTLDCLGGPTPGSAINDSYLYRLPLMATFPVGPAAVAPGIARGVFDALTAGMTGRTTVAGAPVGEFPTVHLRLSEAAAEIDSALALLRTDCAEIDRAGREKRIPDLVDRARYRRDWAYAVEVSKRSVERLLPLSGARGLASGNPVQRLWRDVHAVAAHAALGWDIQGQHHARALMNLPLADPRI